MRELDREDFRRWLAAKDPDEEVGVTGDPHNCGLALYLGSRTGALWTVHPCQEGAVFSSWEEWRGCRPEPLPEWANQFALRFDRITTGFSQPVTAKEALTALDGIDP